MAGSAIEMLERAAREFLEEVPALKPLKLVIGVDLHGRGDMQQFRIEMPDLKVTKDMGIDARVRLDMRRDFFNAMVENGAKVADWHEAFSYGKAKATGVEQYLRLIASVVERQEERSRTRRARH